MDMAPLRCIRHRYMCRLQYSGLIIVLVVVIAGTMAGLAGATALARITGVAADRVRKRIRGCEAVAAGARPARGVVAASR